VLFGFVVLFLLFLLFCQFVCDVVLFGFLVFVVVLLCFFCWLIVFTTKQHKKEFRLPQGEIYSRAVTELVKRKNELAALLKTLKVLLVLGRKMSNIVLNFFPQTNREQSTTKSGILCCSPLSELTSTSKTTLLQKSLCFFFFFFFFILF
jgi:hypothetical protein